LKKCPHCGARVERLPSAPAIQFKGAGWYVTDYASKPSSGDSEKSEKPGAETKEGASKEKESAAKESAAKESKEKKPLKKK
jgi:predicted nucleic acid-binding Zn ribbon protein